MNSLTHCYEPPTAQNMGVWCIYSPKKREPMYNSHLSTHTGSPFWESDDR